MICSGFAPTFPQPPYTSLEPVISSLITTIIVVQFRAVSFKVALSSALKATIALLVIVVVVMVVVVVVVVTVVVVVVVVSRPVRACCVLPLISVGFDCSWIDHILSFLSAWTLSHWNGSYPPSLSCKLNNFLHGLRF
ncbi:hypothetical protein Tco_1029530 [Tanacetum coccineum]|uniref:Uncharacterized protein n=1 Tax=Tanacetum coccineum TaxID=301880 RepID=A0ABQ5G493_9ASTR